MYTSLYCDGSKRGFLPLNRRRAEPLQSATSGTQPRSYTRARREFNRMQFWWAFDVLQKSRGVNYEQKINVENICVFSKKKKSNKKLDKWVLERVTGLGRYIRTLTFHISAPVACNPPSTGHGAISQLLDLIQSPQISRTKKNTSAS